MQTAMQKINIYKLIFPITAMIYSLSGQENFKVIFTDVLNIGKNDEFIRIEEVTSDKKGYIYVTDAYDFSVKKFSADGNMITKYGKRGTGEGNFQAPPYKVICRNDTLAIVTKGAACIQLFTANFIYLGQFSLPGTITDIVFNEAGQIVAGIIPFDKDIKFRLLLAEKSGKIIASAPLELPSEGPAYDVIHLWSGRGNTIITAYRFRNMIAVYNHHLKLIKYFHVPDLPMETPSIANTNIEIGKMPEGDLIQDLCLDPHGNILILVGDYSESPNRAIYLFDPEGSFKAHFKLPNKSGILYIDEDGYLYTREQRRRILKKYRINQFISEKGKP